MFKSKPPPPRWTMPGILLAAALSLYSGAPAHAVPPSVPLLIGDTLDEQGKPRAVTGAKRKLFDALERELGVVFELRMYPWARAERYAMAGDGLIFGLPKTDEHMQALRYSNAATHRTLWLVTRSDATFNFNKLEDLHGKTLGVVRGYSYGEEFDSARDKQLFRTDDDISSRGTRLTRLMLKRVDAVLLFQPSSQSARDIEIEIAAFMAPRLRTIGAAANAAYRVLPKPLSTDSHQFFAIARAKDDGIIDRINAALARIQQRAPN